MKLIDAKASVYTSEPTKVGDAKSVFVHVYSASTSSATVLIQQSLDNGDGWATVATISNPTSAGELWKGPSCGQTRVKISVYASGTITASCDFAQAEVATWTAIVGTAPGSMFGQISKTWTNAEVVAAGTGALVGDVLVGTLPANSVALGMYMIVNTQGVNAAGTLTGAVGVVAAGYTDWIGAADLKAVAGTIYGNAAAERGTDAAILYYTTAKSIYIHFIAVGANLDTVTACTGTVKILYVTYS